MAGVLDNKKVFVKKTKHQGLGVFAEADILKGEVIAMFDGDVYEYEYEGWTDDLCDHVVQFAEDKWRDSNGIAKMLNHSCEPNCGIKELFKIVAMRDIQKGEELFWDYEMTERNKHEWKMKCQCGTKGCRKLIGDFDNMPASIRNKYKGYISEWLLTA